MWWRAWPGAGQSADADPATTVAGIIAVIDPGVLAETVTAAVHAAAPRAGQRRRLAWALQDDPGLLTGAGARAPVPSVLRLIDALAGAGSQKIVRPACAHCGRVIALARPRDGCGSAATAWPGPAPKHARAAACTGRRPPATSTDGRCVPTA